MSVASNSSVHSSSVDDFVTFLEDELDSAHSDSLPDEDPDDLDGCRYKRRKVEQFIIVEEAPLLTLYASFEEKTELTVDDSCLHPGFVRNMCYRCGKRVDDATGVALGYIHKDLKLGSDELSRLRNADVKNLLQRKKLYLVLDLDHTLLNSTQIDDISPDEEYLKSKTDSLEDVLAGSLFELPRIRMRTKLRPYVRTFLKESSNLFEMYIYTMGEHPYALEMAKLLDPTKSYFEDRVISRSDCTQQHQKGLDVVLGHESAVIILDDTEAVWQKHKDNLILMDRYHYFSSSCRQHSVNAKSLAQLKSDENESDGALATVLEVLKRVHCLFFDPARKDDVASRDTRQVVVKLLSCSISSTIENSINTMLSIVRKEVLKGCKLVFTGDFHTKFSANEQPLWKTAEKLGAECTMEIDASVTHVVSLDARTEKSRWAVKEKKFLVHPRWIKASLYLWKRQLEDQFPVPSQDQKSL